MSFFVNLFSLFLAMIVKIFVFKKLILEFAY